MDRLREKIPGVGQRFAVLWGPGLDGRFRSAYGGSWDFEHALARILRDAGYHRIVFYTPRRGLYYADPESRTLTRLPPSPALQRGPNSRRLAFSGPLGDRFVIPLPDASGPGRMGDAGVLAILDHVMSAPDASCSAVVLRPGLAGIFASPLWPDIIASWAALPTTVANLCLWVVAVAGEADARAQLAQVIPSELGLEALPFAKGYVPHSQAA